jgi:dipeptidyl aminopeptidase/acylaminoacyl peptidase
LGSVYVGSPNPLFSPDGRTLLVSSTIVVLNEVTESSGWTAPYSDGSVGRLVPFDDGAGSITGVDCEDQAIRFLDDGRLLAQCWSRGASSTLLRVAGLDGRSIRDAWPAESGFGSGWGEPLIAPGGRVYLWDPQAARLGRLDPDSGAFDVSDAFGKGTAAAAGWLTLLDWIAPSVQAKILLQPALALSPDGSTLYALGSTFGDGGGPGWSTGIYVVDPETLALRARWAPTADYSSITVSSDGRYVVLAGAPGGAETEASMTVLDAGSGDVRAFAPGLGRDWLVFADPDRGDW